MLGDNDAKATVAVRDLRTAKRFYEETLGLAKVMENEEVLAFKSGASTLFVYRSQHAGTNKATAVLSLVTPPTTSRENPAAIAAAPPGALTER